MQADRIWKKKEMCGTTDSSFQSSKALNYRRMITHAASESVGLYVYCTTNRR